MSINLIPLDVISKSITIASNFSQIIGHIDQSKSPSGNDSLISIRKIEKLAEVSLKTGRSVTFVASKNSYGDIQEAIHISRT